MSTVPTAPCEIVLTAAKYDLTDAITISRNLTIKGEWPSSEGGVVLRAVPSDHRVLKVTSGSTVQLMGVVVSGGHTKYPDGGSGIYNEGNLILINSAVIGNEAQSDGPGGGILNNGSGSVMLTNSSVSNNVGNGISNFGGGNVTLINSPVSSNSAGQGGGLLNRGTMTLINSPVGGNKASDLGGCGGGITNFGSLALINSPVTGNTNPHGSTGGICNFHGELHLRNSTVSGNTAQDGEDLRAVRD